jgi:hypothetical protein
VKKLTLLLLVTLVSLACTVPTYANRGVNPEARAAQKRAKQQQKAMKKYVKAQKKALKKIQKQERKRERPVR